MKIIKLLSVLLFTSTLVSANEPVSINSQGFAEKVIHKVESIIEGAELSTFKENISPSAYVIYNKKYESFYAMWSNDESRQEFIAEEDVMIEFSYQRISEDLKSAYLILKTETVSSQRINWHTINYEIDENEQMKILNWHKS